MGELKTVSIPDIGDFQDVPVIEVFVDSGTHVKEEDSLVALESDKATIDIPAPYAGVVKEVKVKTGDKVSEGTPIVLIETAETTETAETAESAEKTEKTESNGDEQTPGDNKATEAIQDETTGKTALEQKQPETSQPQSKKETDKESDHSAFSQARSRDLALSEDAFSKPHAGPAVRRFARELGVDLELIKGSGPKQRILKEDVQAYVKANVSQIQSDHSKTALDLLPWPQVDFSKFGPVERKSLSRIQQKAAANLHRNWVIIPHVTQFDEADITDLEALRKESNAAAKNNTVKLTLLSFLMKALIAPLKKFPEFNASLDNDANGEASLIIKRYYHIGFAVDTQNGLVVPVIRDVDQKGIMAIARELSELSDQAREGKLKPEQMQGAGFTISSLGGIGGTAFTPIINAPEVAILGVSRASYKPVYRNGQFDPRLVLPISLSYDHRVVDGAAAARFTSYLAEVLTDMRLALL